MRQLFEDLTIATGARGFHDLTPTLRRHLAASGLREGLVQISCLHTSCSLTVNENADPRVRADLEAHFRALVPEAGSRPISGEGALRPYSHADEGPDDMPAHLRTALTATSLGLSFREGRLLLGTWQAVYLWEHRDQSGLRRRLTLHWLGED
ncbi:YjbQ family protein [Synechococcus sp. RSCCF101]|uniref:secondary thiamine-phosphate synthase enzyme YjbQ n=1 Tax=Synechococcus sp. RSCCF101 TaxID=2511069 RepID=UPI001248CE2D|nr:secondary thiamine-phosphate synthase enzyme YjbQ [Synechococcus sp. RSCCF101]QEY31402.1 YjbQ family protein [Synechococcus sp. RSCCF101]